MTVHPAGRPLRASLVFALVLLCSVVMAWASSAPGPYGDVAVVDAPPGYSPSWTANQMFPNTGFCLNTTEGRVLTNWSDPLYAKRIVVATEGGPGMSLVSHRAPHKNTRARTVTATRGAGPALN